MARRAKRREARQADEALIALFLDMLAAERGAGRNTLEAYGRDLAGLAAYLKPPAAPSPRRRHEDLRDYLGVARRPWLQGGDRGAASLGIAAALPFPLRRGKTQRRSGRGAGRPQTWPRAAQGFVDRRGRRAARSGAARRRRQSGGAGGAPARGAAQLPDRGGLRHRPARLRTGGVARLGRQARPAHAGGARQGRQGAAGAAQPGGQAQHGRVSRLAQRGSARGGIKMAVSIVRRARATSPGSTSPAT